MRHTHAFEMRLTSLQLTVNKTLTAGISRVFITDRKTQESQEKTEIILQKRAV